jgi:cytochrome c
MRPTKILAISIAAIVAFSSASAMAKVNGEKLFKKKCGTCHSIEPGKHKVGPSLAGVIGRKAGSTDFTHYKALKGADFTWDEAKIGEWITNPRKYIGKPTAMTVKVKKAEDRAAIIDYLKTVK